MVHSELGHLGQKKAVLKAEELLYWPNMTDIRNSVLKCQVCQQLRLSLQQRWQEFPPVGKALERIGIDLTEIFTGTHQYCYVLTFIDHFSRFVQFFPLRIKEAREVYDSMSLILGLPN